MFKYGLNEVVQLADVVLFLHSISDKKCRSVLIFLLYVLWTENYLSSVWFGLYLFSHSLRFFQ